MTRRDIAIIREVNRHRLLRSSEISRLVGGSHQQVLRRLQRLFHHGYLDRPRAQLNSMLTGGSQAIVYALGRKGARLLADEGTLPPRHDNFRLHHPYLEHTTAVAEFMVSLEQGLKEHPDARLISEEALADRVSLRDPFLMNVKVGSQRVGLRPDRMFALEKVSSGESLLCCLELDRGTMPVRRRTLARSSFQRKLLTYESAWRQQLHHTRFGYERLRVLTVTSSEQRLRNLIEECRKLDSGHGLFLFATKETVKASSPLECDWHGVDDDTPVRLLPF